MAFSDDNDLCVYELQMRDTLMGRQLHESLLDSMNFIPEVTIRILELTYSEVQLFSEYEDGLKQELTIGD